jgi:hypothetical protein
VRAWVAVVAGALLSGCIVRYIRGPQLTGTCDGACDHYLQCRGGDIGGVREACLAECPLVFGERDSIMAFESLSCPDTVEFVEGPARRPLGAERGSSGNPATAGP